MSSRSAKTKTNSWTILNCELETSQEDTCSWLLFEQGSQGLEISNIDAQRICINASFHPEDLSKENLDDLRYKFTEAGLSQVADTFKVENLAHQDWMTNWKKHFKPFYIGKAFLICPPWSTKQLSENNKAKTIKIIIDPGMAFGTGLHATTSYCLQSIRAHLAGPNILDVGTGSGILAIASLLVLPEAKITAIDNDENSIDNATHNFALNNLEGKIQLVNGDLQDFVTARKQKFNSILSNMTAEVIVHFMPIYDALLEKDGILILAGIIEERLSLLEDCISQYPFEVVDKGLERGWIGLTLKKTSG